MGRFFTDVEHHETPYYRVLKDIVLVLLIAVLGGLCTWYAAKAANQIALAALAVEQEAEARQARESASEAAERARENAERLASDAHLPLLALLAQADAMLTDVWYATNKIPADSSGG